MKRYDFFVSHATPDRDAADRLTKALSEAGARVFLAAQDTLVGDRWRDTIAAAHRDARITIVLLSEHTADAVYQLDEIQVSIEMTKQSGGHMIVPVIIDATNDSSRFGLRAFQALAWAGASRKQMATVVAAAREALTRLGGEEQSGGIRDRGGFLRPVFQGYTNTELLSPLAPTTRFDYEENRRQLLGDIQRHRRARLNEQLLYTSRSCAKAWLELCGSQYYAPYRDSRRLFDEHADEIARRIGQDSKATAFDLISLGPGGGEKDRPLLHSFAALDRSQLVYYYLVDISQYLIAHACNEVMQDTLVRSNVRVIFINDEFDSLERLRAIYSNNGRRNVFSLLGNTLGNYEEGMALSWIMRGMEPQDYLIIEYQERKPKTRAANGQRDYSDAKRAFFIAPLRMMGWSDDDLEFSTVASTTAVTVPGSEKFVTSARSKDGEFQLTETTQYRRKELVDWLGSKHLTLVGKPFQGETVGILVTRYDPPGAYPPAKARPRAGPKPRARARRH